MATDDASMDELPSDVARHDGYQDDAIASDVGQMDATPADVAAVDAGVSDVAQVDDLGSSSDAPDTTETDAMLDAVHDVATDTNAFGVDGSSDVFGSDATAGSADSAGTQNAPDTSTPDVAVADSQLDSNADTLSAAGDGTSASDAAAAFPPWPVDAWSGAVAPVSQGSFPGAGFVDVTAAYGLAAKGAWAYCAAVGFVDDNDVADAVFIEFIGSSQGPPKAVIRALLLGTKPQVVASAFDTSLLFPDGGCAVADMDGDGDGDLLVAGSSGLAYYKGDGKGGFSDVSAALLPMMIPANVWSLAIDDFDGDGRLDVYLGAGKQPDSCEGVSCKHTATDFICAYDKPPLSDPFDDDRLLLQQPDGKLVDVTSTWKPAKGGIATSVASWDFDGDGYPEVLIGNDFGPHPVLLNAGGKSFGKSVAAGFMPYAHAMGWGIGDLNGDGATDLVVADAGPLNIYAGKPGSPLGPWAPLPPAHPIAAATWRTSSWVPQLADFDHDGDLDIYLGVTMYASTDLGKVLTACDGNTGILAASDLLLTNNGGFNFAVSAVTKGNCGRVAPLAQSLIDLDGDGDLDVIQVRADCDAEGGRLRFLRNDLPKAGGAAVIRLIGGKGNRDAIGARLSTTVASSKVTRRIVGCVGVGSSGARVIHIGLGSAASTGPITVIWPGGKQTQHGAVKAGATVTWKAP